MPMKLRVGTFNVENLFQRAKVLNFADPQAGAQYLAKIEQLRTELGKKKYDPAKILKLYNQLKDYIEIVEVRQKLFNGTKTKVVARGVDDWSGFIQFKTEKFTETTRKNTALVIRDLDVALCGLVEVESRPVLQHFFLERLPGTGSFKNYPHQMLIDGNDAARGIDVALASRFPIRNLRSHVDDSQNGELIFSRDCLEAEVVLPGGPIWLLINHFKSKANGSAVKNNQKRRMQAERVASILAQNYDLQRERVIVAGDFNDTPDSDPLSPLLQLGHLYDVLALKFPDPRDRWTYHFKQNEQIDYLLVSEPLRAAFQDAGVNRRGIYDVDKYTGGAIKPYPTVTHPSNSASDHGAIWAEFEVE
jgi:endonuclease/exonuclease/phosphatase family metal-dependent hydrolase